MDTSPETISKKELFERLIALETKIDLIDRDNQRMDKKFSLLVVLVVVLEIVNILVHALVRLES